MTTHASLTLNGHYRKVTVTFLDINCQDTLSYTRIYAKRLLSQVAMSTTKSMNNPILYVDQAMFAH